MRSALFLSLASLASLGSLALGAGCTTDDATPTWVTGFDPPAVTPGFTRYVTPTVTNIQPGDDVQYCQWVAGPSDVAKDVLAFDGAQSATGHHAVVYATSNTSFPVGESHICTVADMIPLSFIGAIGGEGTAGVKLPDGLFFRLPAGQAIMVNTHWLNATDGVVDGQAVVDVEFAPTDDTRMIADIFANNGDTFAIESGAHAAYDTTCVLQQDLSFAMAGNHMHAMGTSAYSELIHADGSPTTMIKADAPWVTDEQFNPTYTIYGLDTPLIGHTGDTYHNHCEWQNTTSDTLMFPDEMCVGDAFYFPGDGQITCSDGTWSH